ncbi:MAG: ATP-binding cassette domain-containing protein [Lachnospiraceae bacterium]|jgi:ABC-2 type transport system ATP-binding protein|nr:ATP-binding cassette domain-containing protein [Lachnospiraceae bacterium]MCI8872733.1 ATP-binding cassette domain-containing protein [Lachnospiraceae bacterium]
MKITVKDLTKEIKGVRVLNGINLEMEDGYIYGLQGKNGSGKTMFMRAVCGFILPTKGSITIDGKVLGKDMSFPESAGMMIENPAFLPNLTGFDNLKLLASVKGIIGKDEIEEALHCVGLEPLDKRKYRKYSLGMKQRLGIACAIMENPKLLVLDEPFNALDSEGERLLREILIKRKEAGTLIILSCHDKDELEALSDQIFLVENGVFSS